MEALDINRDGKIDEKEMSEAASSLRKLDRNRDGVLDFNDISEPGKPQKPGVKPG